MRDRTNIKGRHYPPDPRRSSVRRSIRDNVVLRGGEDRFRLRFWPDSLNGRHGTLRAGLFDHLNSISADGFPHFLISAQIKTGKGGEAQRSDGKVVETCLYCSGQIQQCHFPLVSAAPFGRARPRGLSHAFSNLGAECRLIGSIVLICAVSNSQKLWA
jgi:hypothetical protein